jgi:hypothetical protein
VKICTRSPTTCATRSTSSRLSRAKGKVVDAAKSTIGQVTVDRGCERSLVAEARAEVTADDDPPFAFGHPLELLEQHRLPDPPQARDAKVAALLRIILEQLCTTSA